MIKKNLFLSLFGLFFFMFSCQGQEKQEKKEIHSGLNRVDSLKLGDMSSICSPWALLQNIEKIPSEKFLTAQSQTAEFSKEKKALFFGMYFASIFFAYEQGKNKLAVSYCHACRDLAKNLKISSEEAYIEAEELLQKAGNYDKICSIFGEEWANIEKINHESKELHLFTLIALGFNLEAIYLSDVKTITLKKFEKGECPKCSGYLIIPHSIPQEIPAAENSFKVFYDIILKKLQLSAFENTKLNFEEILSFFKEIKYQRHEECFVYPCTCKFAFTITSSAERNIISDETYQKIVQKNQEIREKILLLN